ncbi:threonyl-tRNA synthetase [Platysternon megacephalum]|uniref:Threonyl-tRNA synthetase n=1 Tax=Platysternon megacephalum TaxID=55544 RepID=A0A4D9DMW5_9SAUR|nr:threonyl-tRNA synthetase [Platysternon megacephalum]
MNDPDICITGLGGFSAEMVLKQRSPQQCSSLLRASVSENTPLSSATEYYFIANNQAGKAKETLGLLSKLALQWDRNKSQFLVKEQSNNSAELVKKLRSTLQGLGSSSPKSTSIQDMAVTARELGIQVDEDDGECWTAPEHIEEITAEIQDVAKYKRAMLRLQGDLWKSLAKVEKELCRMKGQRDVPPEDYRSQLRERWR